MSREQHQITYRELFRQHIDKDTLLDTSETLNHELVLVWSYFKEKIEAIIKRKTQLGKPGRPRVEVASPN